MKKGVLGIILLASPLVQAGDDESWLCIAEHAAGVSQNGESLSSDVYNPESFKFIQSKKDGVYTVKRHGDKHTFFPNCVSMYYCDGGEWVSGMFMRNNRNNFFRAYTMTGSIDKNNKREINEDIVSVGRCTKL